MNITISVIIPTFNRKEVVQRAIDSVLAQTVRPLDIIVIDDGSTDGTPDMLKTRYAERIMVLTQEHHGVSAARNTGIKASRGTWLSFLDSDDVWHENKLEEQVRYIEEHPETEIVQTEEIWIRNGKRVNPMNKHAKQDGYIFLQCLPFCIVTPSSVLIKRTLLDRVGLFDEKLPTCEDYDLWLRIAKDTPIHLIQKKLMTRYGGHADQLSAQYWGMDRFRVRTLRKLLRTSLTPEQRQQVIQELKKKCAVLAHGAWKRKNILRWIFYGTLSYVEH